MSKPAFTGREALVKQKPSLKRHLVGFQLDGRRDAASRHAHRLGRPRRGRRDERDVQPHAGAPDRLVTSSPACTPPARNSRFRRNDDAAGAGHRAAFHTREFNHVSARRHGFSGRRAVHAGSERRVKKAVS